MLFVAGAAIAPTFASAYAMVDRVAPAGAVTEAFAWLATALAVGGAAGAAAGGAVADGAGPAAAFALAGGAGVVAVLVTGGARAHARREMPCSPPQRTPAVLPSPSPRPETAARRC